VPKTKDLADDTLDPADADSLADVLSYTDLAITQLYASVNLFDGKAKLTGGKIANYDYDLGTGISDYASGGNVANDGYFFDGTQAILLQLFPVEGLNLGVAALPGSDLDILYVAARYDMDGIGSVVVESKLASELGDSRASAAFQFTGVEGLTASAGYKLNADVGYKMASLAESTVFGIINYAAGDLTVELAPEYRLEAGKLYIEGYVSYAMGDFTFNVLGAYDATSSGDTLGAEYFFGAEAYYNVGKGQVMAGFYYDDINTWSIPLVVKVSF